MNTRIVDGWVDITAILAMYDSDPRSLGCVSVDAENYRNLIESLGNAEYIPDEWEAGLFLATIAGTVISRCYTDPNRSRLDNVASQLMIQPNQKTIGLAFTGAPGTASFRIWQHLATFCA